MLVRHLEHRAGRKQGEEIRYDRTCDRLENYNLFPFGFLGSKSRKCAESGASTGNSRVSGRTSRHVVHDMWENVYAYTRSDLAVKGETPDPDVYYATNDSFKSRKRSDTCVRKREHAHAEGRLANHYSRRSLERVRLSVYHIRRIAERSRRKSILRGIRLFSYGEQE